MSIFSPSPDCIEQHGEVEKDCRDYCTNQSVDCMKNCGDTSYCQSKCQDEMHDCTKDCPCHEVNYFLLLSKYKTNLTQLSLTITYITLYWRFSWN